MSTALLLVDIQNDFCPGGSLAVEHGNEIVEVANQLMPAFDYVIATKDWHPKDHVSFASRFPEHNLFDTININGIEQTLWPDHCIQNSHGSDFTQGLNTSAITHTIYKGTNKEIDSYSGFFDNARLNETGLDKLLKENNITDLFIMGLATDYCVKFTVLDACSLGYKVYLIEDGIRGVNQQPSDSQNAISEMVEAGAKTITAESILSN